MHERVRKEFCAYASDEALSGDELIAGKYRGIRPAPAYPAQPDHTEKATLFRLLRAEARVGVKLRESFAMCPGSPVSGSRADRFGTIVEELADDTMLVEFGDGEGRAYALVPCAGRLCCPCVTTPRRPDRSAV